MANGVQAMVFDVGGVLLRWDPERIYERLIPDAAERHRFLAEVVTGSWNRQMDAGLPFAEGVARLTAEHPHHAALIAAFHHDWARAIGPQIDGTVALLHRLKDAGLPVYGLTNFSAETWPTAVGLYPVLTAFDDVIVSGRERLLKPDPAIYRLLTDRFGLDPHGVFFTDDTDENVVAARAAGWQAVVFRDPDQLRDDLRAAGAPV